MQCNVSCLIEFATKDISRFYCHNNHRRADHSNTSDQHLCGHFFVVSSMKAIQDAYVNAH